MDRPALDRSHFEVFAVGSAPDPVDERSQRSHTELIAAALFLREATYGRDHLAERIHRVFEVLQAPWSTDAGIRGLRGEPPRRPRTTGDLDLWCGVDSANWERRCTVEAGGIEIAFVDRESLIQGKVAAGGPQDLADLAIFFGLPKVRHGICQGVVVSKFQQRRELFRVQLAHASGHAVSEHKMIEVLLLDSKLELDPCLGVCGARFARDRR